MQPVQRWLREPVAEFGWLPGDQRAGQSGGGYAESGMGPSVRRAGVPAVEVVGELVVEDAGSDLEQEVGAAGCPAHLLFLYHALADDLVDRGFGERGGDGLASAVAFPVVGDPAGVGGDVAVELADRLEQPGLLMCQDSVMSRSKTRLSMVCRARKTLPCQQNHFSRSSCADGPRRRGRSAVVPGNSGSGGGRSQVLGHVRHDGDPHRQVVPVQQVLGLGVEVTGGCRGCRPRRR